MFLAALDGQGLQLFDEIGNFATVVANGRKFDIFQLLAEVGMVEMYDPLTLA